MKKTVKIIATILVVLFLAIGGAVVYLLHFLSTPEKVTPLVCTYTSSSTNANFSCQKAELILREFPVVSLHITQGALVTPQSMQGTSAEADTILCFRSGIIHFNLEDYLQKGTFVLPKVVLQEAKLYGYVSEKGVANWECFFTGSTAPSLYKIVIDNIEGKDITLLYYDAEIDRKIELLNTKLFLPKVEILYRSDVPLQRDTIGFNISQLDALGDFKYHEKGMDLDVRLPQLKLWIDGLLATNRSAFKASAKVKNANIRKGQYVFFFPDTLFAQTTLTTQDKNNYVNVKNLFLQLRDIGVITKGWARRDKVSTDFEMDLDYNINAPITNDLFALVPLKYAKEQRKTQLGGAVFMNGKIYGWLTDKAYPSVKMNAEWQKGTAQYEGMPYGIEKLDMKLKGDMHFDNKTPSDLTIERFDFRGAESHLTMTGHINDIFGDFLVKAKLKGNMDFTKLYNTFEWKKGVDMGGILKADFETKFKKSDAQKINYAQLFFQGTLNAQDIFFTSVADSVYLESQHALVTFDTESVSRRDTAGTTSLRARVLFDNTHLKYKKNIAATVDSFRLRATMPKVQVVDGVIAVRGGVGFKRMEATVGDSVWTRWGATRMRLEMLPSERNKQFPKIMGKITTDSVRIFMGHTRARLTACTIEGETEKIETKKSKKILWRESGTINFKAFRAYSKAFPLRIRMSETRLSYKPNEIILDSAKVRVGKSSFSLTGSLYNLRRFMRHRDVLSGNLFVESSALDVSQLMTAYDTGTQFRESGGFKLPEGFGFGTNIADATSTSGEVDVKGDDEMTVFVIPDSIDFTVRAKMKDVLFGKIKMDSLNGDFLVNNKALTVNDMKIKALDTKMLASLYYRATDKTGADGKFAFHMDEVDVKKLLNLIPSIDSTLPMLRSFEGIVACDIAMSAALDSNLYVKMPTINGVTAIKGKNLVLLDGETFSEIAKQLNFQQKKKNTIDSLSVIVSVKNNFIYIYPFILSMDKYKAAIAGRHKMDMTFDYHISLLNPMPLGLNVRGSLDNMKYSLSPVLFKDTNIPSSQKLLEKRKIQIVEEIKAAARKQ